MKQRILRFIENYYDDAERLALYLAARDNSKIMMEKCPSELFPTPPKMKSVPDEVEAFCVSNYQIAYLEHRDYPEQDAKYRNRTLHRIMLGERLKEARQKKGVSLETLEIFTGIRAKNIENIEHGRFDATIDILGNIGDALDCHIDFVEND